MNLLYQYDMDFSLDQLLKNKTWREALSAELSKDYFIQLENFLKAEYQKGKTIFPAQENIFAALNNLDLSKVKVVILGQDPYHGVGEAHGLSFSVPEGVRFPPSLRNILKELQNDLSIAPVTSGDLKRWEKEGVLLLNAVLTVEKDKAASHQKKGWENFTDKVISTISKECEHVVFILWGAFAQKKTELIDQKKHLVIKSVHPSPLSSHRGFFGSKPFSKTNTWLTSHGIKPVSW